MGKDTRRQRRSRSRRGVCGIPPGATGNLGTIRSPRLANVTGVNRIALDPTEFRPALPPQFDPLIEDPGLKRLEQHQTAAMGLKCAANSVAGRLCADGREPGPCASAVSCNRESKPSRLTPTRSRPSRMRQGDGHRQTNAAHTTGISRPPRLTPETSSGPPYSEHGVAARYAEPRVILPSGPRHRADGLGQAAHPPPLARASDAAPRADRGRGVPGAARRVVAPSMPRQRSSSHTP